MEIKKNHTIMYDRSIDKEDLWLGVVSSRRHARRVMSTSTWWTAGRRSRQGILRDYARQMSWNSQAQDGDEHGSEVCGRD